MAASSGISIPSSLWWNWALHPSRTYGVEERHKGRGQSTSKLYLAVESQYNEDKDTHGGIEDGKQVLK